MSNATPTTLGNERVITKWGRSYVGSWIEKDRAAGIRFDPRVEAYAIALKLPSLPNEIYQVLTTQDALQGAPL